MEYNSITYRIEEEFLSPYATKAADTKGRRFPMEKCTIRTDFQRDRDRILHCKAFRRLKHKTQVFLAPEGDHYRTRLTHTLEVSQIARTIARALRLNEDLTEAIALSHDLGHTPYGHAGEKALNRFTNFKHNEQSLRVVDVLEYDGKGMNLTFEVRDGIVNHTSSGNPATLEGKVVSWSDRIAYINHDIDDAIRGNIISQDDIPKQFLELFGETHGKRINNMILNILENSYGKNYVSPSEEYKENIALLRQFMFDKIYFSSAAKSEEGKAIDMIAYLYEYFYKHLDKIPRDILEIDSTKEQKVCDYISMMSDNYAVMVYKDITIPKNWTLL